MYRFEYATPKTIDEAERFFNAKDDATYLAGGMTLVPTLKQRLTQPSELIDLSKIESLKGISFESGVVKIGAMTTHAQVAQSSVVHNAIPALSGLAGEIGDASVRNRGTLGGSLANSDPSADYPAAVLGLDATIKTNKRTIAADEYFLDLFETALDEGELIMEVQFKQPEKACYLKFPNPASRYAMVGVFVAKFPNAVHVAVTGAGPCAFRLSDMEQKLLQNFTPQAIEGCDVSADGLNEDIHASAPYRADLIKTLVKRAIKQLL